MHIGLSYASTTLVSWQRGGANTPASDISSTAGSDGSGGGAAVVNVAASGVSQGHFQHHGGDGDGGARGDGHRMQRMAAMLQKLSASLPQDGQAAYAALVVGPNGARAVAATSGDGGTAVSAVGADVSGVTTGAGNDAVALTGITVAGIDTGAGSDALAILAGTVSGISTDGADGSGTGNDAVAILAQAVSDVSTGGGADSVSVVADLVAGVDAGAGDDAVTVQAQVVAGISGGEGNDAITVSAGTGAAGFQVLAALFGLTGGGDGGSVRASAGVSADGTSGASAVASVSDAAAQAKALYADVSGGAGNDVITVASGGPIAISGGTGDDVLNLSGGTAVLMYGAGDGNDTVNLSQGSQVVLQLSPDAGAYSVEFTDQGTVVHLGDSSVTFKGASGAIGIVGSDGTLNLVAPEAGAEASATPQTVDMAV